MGQRCMCRAPTLTVNGERVRDIAHALMVLRRTYPDRDFDAMARGSNAQAALESAFTDLQLWKFR
jgi:hypothetical protein